MKFFGILFSAVLLLPITAWTAVASTPLFGDEEIFDANKPECFDRIISALQMDPEAKALYDDVMTKSRAKNPRDIIHFGDSKIGFEDGKTLVEVVGDTDQTVVAGWPNILPDGHLPIDKADDPHLRVSINITPGRYMISTYSSLIHEMTHAQGHLNMLGKKASFDVLDYTGPADYATQKINEPGGEVDAFAAEITAVIRYRMRTHASYESTHSLVAEKFFDFYSAKILDRNGFVDYVTNAFGSMSYFNNYSEVFRLSVIQEIQYLESAAKSIESMPSLDQFPQHQEEMRRLRLRAKKIRQSFSSILN